MAAISVLGLGNMGSAVARSFLAAGHDVTVWNRSPARCEPLVAVGAKAAGTPAAAIAAGEVSVLLLSDYAAIGNVLSDAFETTDSPVSGTILNLTTGLPDEAATMQQTVTGRGLGYLDGAVLGYPRDIGGTASIVISGPQDLWRRCREILAAMGTGTVFVGETIGSGNVIDCAITGGFFVVALGAFFEATAFAASYGVPAIALVPHAVRWAEHLVPEIALGTEQISAGDYTTDQATIDVYEHALTHITEAVRRTGPAHLSAAVTANLRAAQAAGRGNESIAAIHAALVQPYARLSIRSATPMTRPVGGLEWPCE